MVASAGNSGAASGRLTDPAVDPYVLAVGAEDTNGTATPSDDTIPSFSSRGDGTRNPDLVAPGVHIAEPAGARILHRPGVRRRRAAGDRLLRGSGTSQAAAVVSGAVALILQAHPSATPDQVKAALLRTAVPLPAADDQAEGNGLINLRGADPAVAAAGRRAAGLPQSTGRGSLEGARGIGHAVLNGVRLQGDCSIFGDRSTSPRSPLRRRTAPRGTARTGAAPTGRPAASPAAAGPARSWAGTSWAGTSWASGTWTGTSWAGTSWAGTSWAGTSWAGSVLGRHVLGRHLLGRDQLGDGGLDMTVRARWIARRLRRLQRLQPQLLPGLPAYPAGSPPQGSRSASLNRGVPAPPAGVRTSPPRTPLVATGIAVLTVLAAALWTALPHGRPPLHRDVQWAWWVFALLFGAAEMFVLHVQIRREARTVSLSDIPLVAGLFMLTPTDLLIARLLGPLLVFALHRRQGLLKLAFNAALLLAEVSLAVGVFHLLIGAIPTGPRSWLAAYVAVTAAGAFAAMAVTIVIGVAEGVLAGRDVWSAAGSGATVAVMLTTLGLVAVNALVANGDTAWLLLGCVVTTLVMYRAYASLSDRHLSLERLYHFSQAVGRTPGVDEVLRSVLSEARELLRAERSEVAFLPEGTQSSGVRVTAGPAGLFWEKSPADPLPAWLWHRIVRRMAPTLLPRSTKNDYERAYLARRGWHDAIIVPLRGESGAIGALVVADRMGNVRTFDTGDVRLLETVANHAAVALRNGTLIDQLTHEAMHDSLTGLPNRALLQRRLGEALTAADAHGRPVAVMIMDLDGFKDVNDTLGHQSGDDLLVEVARRMTATAGHDVTVARLGGDEFAVLLPQVRDAATAVRAAERLLVALEPPVTLADIDVQIRASVGAAVTPARAGTTMSELLKQADVAMYAAKVRGGGVRLFDSAMNTSSPEQLALVAELRRAIAEDQLSVYVQPKVSISTGRVSGVEALVRWEHPRHGLLSPPPSYPSLSAAV